MTPRSGLRRPTASAGAYRAYEALPQPMIAVLGSTLIGSKRDVANGQFLSVQLGRCAAYPWNRMSPTTPASPITYGSLSILK